MQMRLSRYPEDGIKILLCAIEISVGYEVGRRAWLICLIVCRAALLAGLALNPLWFSVANAQERELRDVEAQWKMFDQYCVTCHNFEDWAGSIAFDTLSPADIAENAHTFETAIRKMRGRLMPPPGNEKPGEESLDDFIASLENYLDAYSEEHGINPGYTAVHRLNRTEYENSIRSSFSIG